MRVPLFDLRPQHVGMADELQQIVARFVDEPRFILGEPVERFEQEVCEFLGARHSIGVSSGTDALLCGLLALGVAAGDEVITTPFTFAATAEAILRVGARPVFADIDPATFNIDPEQVARLITPRTRAIVPVHLFGLPAELGAITALAQRHNLAVLEDAAQAFGARYREKHVGTFGALGAFSFFPSKPLGSWGDGGMLVTDDASLAARCRELRSHGKNERGEWLSLGGNFRLDAVQAAVLRLKLSKVPQWQAERAAIAARYSLALSPIEELQVPPTAPHVVPAHALYTVRVKSFGGNSGAQGRDKLRAALHERGIETGVYYSKPLHREPLLAPERTHPQFNPQRTVLPGTVLPETVLPQAERAASEVLSLPLFAGMSEEQQHWVIAALQELYRA